MYAFICCKKYTGNQTLFAVQTVIKKPGNCWCIINQKHGSLLMYIVLPTKIKQSYCLHLFTTVKKTVFMKKTLANN